MVEFVIVLTIISLICLGMLYSSRLLTFQFWAQQEARFIAFEQDWVAKMWGSDPIARLEDGGFFHRPPVVGTLPDTREADDDGGVPTLLARRLPSELPEVTADATASSSARHFARRRTVDIPDQVVSTVLASLPTVVSEAIASERLFPDRRIWSEPRQQIPLVPNKDRSYLPGNQLETIVRQLMVKGEVGEQICARYAAQFRKYGVRELPVFMRTNVDGASANCVEFINNRFPEHLLRTTDLRTVFQTYGEELDAGVSATEGFEQALQEAVAEGFYSFFDSSVRNAFNDATGDLSDGMIMTGLTLAGDSGLQRMLTELRYLGSNIAVGMVAAAIADLALQSANSRNADAEKASEDALHTALFVDASDPIGIGVNGYWLSFDYLPIPPFIDMMFPLMFDGVMRNALSLEDGLFDPLIDESNKSIEVRFQAQTGLQLSVAQRFSNTNKTVRSKFYLVTQPWHITRQQNANSGYRQKGDQDDDSDEETEEALLRRRTFGFWLFPSRPTELLTPILGVLSDELDLTGVIDVFQGFDSVIDTLKSFLFDDDTNPFLMLLTALDSLPLPGDPDISFPQWPTVRPDAYPRSTEIENDRLAGESRDYEKFIKEQRDFNPSADPEYY